MTGEELINEVMSYVQDPSIDSDTVLRLLNEGLLDIAGQTLLPHLETSTEVDTVLGQNYVDLPADYHHGLFRAFNGVSNFPIGVSNSWGQVIEKLGNPARAGNVLEVCVSREQLRYLPIPDPVNTLTIHYYRTPTVIAEDTESDAFGNLTRNYGENALIYYATFKLYDKIEDGIEGQKVNTLRYEGLLLRETQKLQGVLREGVSRPRPPVTRPSW